MAEKFGEPVTGYYLFTDIASPVTIAINSSIQSIRLQLIKTGVAHVCRVNSLSYLDYCLSLRITYVICISCIT